MYAWYSKWVEKKRDWKKWQEEKVQKNKRDKKWQRKKKLNWWRCLYFGQQSRYNTARWKQIVKVNIYKCENYKMILTFTYKNARLHHCLIFEIRESEYEYISFMSTNTNIEKVLIFGYDNTRLDLLLDFWYSHIHECQKKSND